jgi:hypothetical protein
MQEFSVEMVARDGNHKIFLQNSQGLLYNLMRKVISQPDVNSIVWEIFQCKNFWNEEKYTLNI